MTETATWQQLADAEPELAERVRSCFGIRRHATMATLRRDGAPRISGTEVAFTGEGQLEVGSMSGARKALDLQRDPRVALHSPTVDPPPGDPAGWAGEAKVSGVVEELARGDGGSHVFRVHLSSAVHTAVLGDELVVTLWRAGVGTEQMRRS